MTSTFSYQHINAELDRPRLQENARDGFGSAIDSSFDGRHVFICATGDNTVSIYEYINDTWNLKHRINFVNPYSIRCNWDGTRVIIGCPDATIAAYSGKVYILTATGVETNLWSTYTQDTLTSPTQSSAYFGRSVSIAKEHGNCVVVGEPLRDEVHVYYKYAGSSWTKKRTLIVPTTATHTESVAMDYMQRILGVTENASAHSATETTARTMTNNGYVSVSTDIYYMNGHKNNFGECVDIDPSGLFIVVGAPGQPTPRVDPSNSYQPSGYLFGLPTKPQVWGSGSGSYYDRSATEYLDSIACTGYFVVYESVATAGDHGGIDWHTLKHTIPPANHGHTEKNLANFKGVGYTEAWDLNATGTWLRISNGCERIVVGSPRYCAIGKQNSNCVGKIESYVYNSSTGECNLEGAFTGNQLVGRSGSCFGMRFDLDYTGRRIGAMYMSLLQGGESIPAIHVFDWNGNNFFETTPEQRFTAINSAKYGISASGTLGGGVPDPNQYYGGVQATSGSNYQGLPPLNTVWADGIAMTSGGFLFHGQAGMSPDDINTLYTYNANYPKYVSVYKFLLTQTLKGNTLVGGYVAADNIFVGANDGAGTNKGSKKIYFGGTYGTGDNYYAKSTIENRSFYYNSQDTDAHMQGFSEILLNKAILRPSGSAHGIDQIRIKAEEFHVDSYVESDGRYMQTPILTTTPFGQIKLNPEFLVPNESTSCSANALLDVNGDVLIRNRLNIGGREENNLTAADKIPFRIFYDTRNDEVFRRNVTAINNGGGQIENGDHMTSNVCTNIHNFGFPTHRHNSRGEVSGSASYDQSVNGIRLSNESSYIYNDYFAGVSAWDTTFHGGIYNSPSGSLSNTINRDYTRGQYILFSFWYYADSYFWSTGSYRWFVERTNHVSSGSGRYCRVGARVYNDVVHFRVATGVRNFDYQVSLTAVPLGQWNHMYVRLAFPAATNTTSITDFYVNGAERPQASSSNVSAFQDALHAFGGRYCLGSASGSSFTTGAIGNVSFEGADFSGNNMHGRMNIVTGARESAYFPTKEDFYKHGPPSQRLNVRGDIHSTGVLNTIGVSCRQLGVGTLDYTPFPSIWGITLRGNVIGTNHAYPNSLVDLNAIVSNAPESSTGGAYLMALDDKAYGSAVLNMQVGHGSFDQFTGSGADGFQFRYGTTARMLTIRNLAALPGESPYFGNAIQISNHSSSRGNIGISASPHSVYRMYIAGQVYATSGGVLSSDDRIKYNEQTVDNCLSIINKLTPLKYEKLQKKRGKHIVNLGTWIPTDDEWTNVKSDYDWIYEYGFIAQDVKNITELEFLVSGTETSDESDIIDKETYSRISSEEREKYIPDEHGSYVHVDSGETQTPLGLNYSGIFTIAVGAIQELDKQLQAEKQETINLQEQIIVTEQSYDALLERVSDLDKQLQAEKLKTTNLQERILVMEQAYYAMLERVSDLENN